jgi:hypothetical protein
VVAGGNGNAINNNHIYDNWRNGVRLLHVPAPLRGETDPRKNGDNSHRNRMRGNFMGVRSDGTRDPNGYDPSSNPNDHGDGYGDFWWDEQGDDNCWENNRGPGGAQATSFQFPLACPAEPTSEEGDPQKVASQASCAAWDPQDPVLDDPPGCDWFTRPPEPK